MYPMQTVVRYVCKTACIYSCLTLLAVPSVVVKVRLKGNETEPDLLMQIVKFPSSSETLYIVSTRPTVATIEGKNLHHI